MVFTGANWPSRSATENATSATSHKTTARFSKTEAGFFKTAPPFFKKSTPFFEKSASHENFPMRHIEKSGCDFSVCLISAQKRTNAQLGAHPFQ